MAPDNQPPTSQKGQSFLAATILRILLFYNASVYFLKKFPNFPLDLDLCSAALWSSLSSGIAGGFATGLGGGGGAP